MPMCKPDMTGNNKIKYQINVATNWKEINKYTVDQMKYSVEVDGI